MLLIGNGKLVCPDSILSDGAVYIEDGQIVEKGQTAGLKAKYPNAYYIDAGGGIIMPGLTNVHTHLYSTFARGMALSGKAPKKFTEILENLWWKLDKGLTKEDIYYSALIPLIECVKSGTTTIIDHHASPGFIKGSLDQLKKALKVVPVRAALCYEVSDRDGPESIKEGIEENVRFIEECQGGDMITALFGLHASFTVSDKTLTECRKKGLELGCGFHLHVAEGKADVEDAKKKYGMGVVERLNKFGMLGDKSLLAHCIHISEKEMELIAGSNASVAHNPESNMNNAVGAADILKMLGKGVLVGLGTDGMTQDMFQESKFAHLIRKHVESDPRVGFTESGKMLLKNNYEILSRFFNKTLGRIEAGAAADIIITDYLLPTPLSHENFLGHFLYGMSSRDVKTTVINGKVLMEDRVLKGIDEEEIASHSRRLAAELWKRI